MLTEDLTQRSPGGGYRLRKSAKGFHVPHRYNPWTGTMRDAIPVVYREITSS